MKRISIAVAITVILPLLIFPALKAQTANEAVRIEADRMETDQQHNVVTFSGNVVARQEALTIYADRMTVHYRAGRSTGGAKSEATSGTIDTIRARGQVKISRGDWVANGDQLLYEDQRKKVVLTGNAKVWQDNNLVTGEKIVLFLDEGRSIVERGTEDESRVEAFFYPKQKGTDHSIGKSPAAP